MRQAPDTHTHALQQHRQSQNSYPFCSSFLLVMASDMHLQRKIEKTGQKMWIFTLLEVSKEKHYLISFFQPNSYNSCQILFTVVWPMLNGNSSRRNQAFPRQGCLQVIETLLSYQICSGVIQRGTLSVMPLANVHHRQWDAHKVSPFLLPFLVST